jgi:glycosyltransferase involved in cell wall biosynthesis
MKKILVITSGVLPMPPLEGGAVENLLQTYIENDLNNSFVVYSCKPKAELTQTYKNIEYRYINTRTKKFEIMSKFWKVINKLSSKKTGNYFIRNIKKDLKIKKEKFDLVIIENFPTYVLPFKKEYNGKIILHVHNDWLSKQTPGAQSIKQSCKNIYAVSEYVKNRVVEIDNDESNVKLLMNGIDEKRFTGKISEKEKNKIYKKYNICESDILFMYSGKLNEQKGADILLDAFIEFSSKYKNVKLLLIGSSFNLNANDSTLIKDMKNKAKNNNNIIFTGFIDYNEIHKYYSIADIQIVPSQVEDSCPLVVLEGLNSGNAMIVSNSGGIPELVNDKCAIIIKRGASFRKNLLASFEKLYNNKEIVKKMKIESKKNAINFTNKKYIDSFKKLIDNE